MKKLDLLEQYPNIMYLNIADNRIEDIGVLSHHATLTQLNARSIYIYRSCLSRNTP